MRSLIYLRFRALGKWYFVPVLGLFVLLPVFSLLMYQSNAQLAPFFVSTTIGQMCTLLCFWWLCFTLREDMEGHGNELLYSAMKSKNRRLLCDSATLLWYLVHVVVLLAGFCLIDVTYSTLFITVPLQCIFLWCLCYFFACAIQNSTIALMVGFVYAFGGQMLEEPQKSSLTVFGQMGLIKAAVVAGASALLVLLSFFLCKREYKNR